MPHAELSSAAQPDIFTRRDAWRHFVFKLSHATREVDELDADRVRAEIEKLVVSAAKSILDGNGFSYDVPSRAAGNQLYVPELDRIVLKENSNVRSFTGKNQTRKTAIEGPHSDSTVFEVA